MAGIGTGSDDARAEALVTAPAGAALLARLEASGRHDLTPEAQGVPGDVDAATVAAVAGSLADMPVDDLLATAVGAAEYVAGPWTAGAPALLARALRLAPARRRLADAVVARLGPVWAARLDLDAQVWFVSDQRFAPDTGWAPLSRPRPPVTAWVTATWSGLWTASDPADRVARLMADTWEMFPRPVTRWRLRPDPRSRVLEVRGPDAWAALVREHPLARRVRPNTSWEVPGLNQERSAVGALAAIPGQRAVRTAMRRFVEPDWDSVAREWDAVHLTWGGFLLAEGTAIDLDDGDVAMLRNWNSERTLWLNPVLDVAGALPAVPNHESWPLLPSDRPDGPARRAQDRAWLDYLLAR